MTSEVIRAKKCSRCGAINHQTKIRCLKCRNTDFAEVTHSPSGIVLTFTTCTALPERLGERKSQGFVIVQLEEDWNILGQLNNPAEISLGTRVTGKWVVVSKNRDGTPVNGWIFSKEEEDT